MVMTTTFNPKITYRMASMHIDPSNRRKLTPWAYLKDWERSDRDPKTTLDDVATRMQQQWPGNYRVVVKEVHHPEHLYKYSKWFLEFDNPAEETMFRLKWS
jgi:hypothetical protein